MLIHNFKYAFKTLFQDKMLIFWTFAFPIILGTFFNMAFSNIEKSEKLNIINIAIVENEEFRNSQIYQESFKVLSDEKNKDRLFDIQYVTEEKARKLLDDNKITGYLVLEDNPKIVVTTSGVNETILKYVIEEISQTEKIINTLVEAEMEKEIPLRHDQYDYNTVYTKISDMINSMDTNIENISNSNLSYTMIEFYSLMAMTCLYGGVLGMVALNKNLANMSSQGKRIAISPTSKGKIIWGSILASYMTQLIGITLLLIYTTLVFHVDYGSNLLLIVVLALVGCLAGLSLGIAIATLVKSNEKVKIGILMAITMFSCFLSGMMGVTMKYVIDKNIPIVNKLNPASMITDGFYSLYYYDTLNRFYLNVVSLIIFAFVMIGIAVFSLRRQKYDSI
ncbi:MAG: ABC transporter permease [bacterium]|nr:ABC transporter permease [bacterium]